MGNTVTVQLNQPERYQEFIARASFDTEPYLDNRAIAYNTDVTKQELDSLFSTKMFERPYLPDYYNPLEELLGELWTPGFENLAISSIIGKINKYIPYLVVDQSNTQFEYSNYKVMMNLVFYYIYDFSKQLYNYERQFDTVT